MTDSRTRSVVILLVIAFFVITFISFLLFRLSITNKSLKELKQSRDKLFTIIAHDLRSPLSSYQRYAEIVAYLVKHKQFERLDEVLRQIDSIGLHLAALLNNLLEWSLIQQKQLTLAPIVVSSKTFFDTLLPIYRDMAKLKNITIVEDIENNTISIDQDSLSLIIRNLLDNSIKYTPFGSNIYLNCYKEKKNLKITISNPCENMSLMQQAKISALFNENQNFEFGENGLGVGMLLIK